MNQMTPLTNPPAKNILASLYEHAGPGPFDGYFRNVQFEHGIEARIAVFKPTTPGGSTCTMSEARWPASFYDASVLSPEGERGRFGTSSGNEAARLLASLCKAFQGGDACMVLDGYEGNEALVKHFYGKEDGHVCSVRSDGKGWHSVELGERQNWKGQKLHAVSFFVKDKTLAVALASAIGEGLLDFSRIYG